VRSDELLGHGPILEGLWRAAGERRLAHALGFFGPGGVGKFLAAERLVLGLVCAGGPGAPCLACGPCRRALSGTHPDVLVLDAQAEDEEVLRVERIAAREGGGRSLAEFLSLRPMEGGWRCVLVREAERMNEEAQNALLKTLEEPGDDTLLVLESGASERLLPTVRSRLVPVRFAPLPDAALRAVRARAGVPPAQLAPLARWGRGAPGRALLLLAQGAPALRPVLARVLSGELDPLAGAGEALEVEGEFPGKTPAARSRARARAVLDLALEVLADLQRARAGADAAGLAHGDLVPAAAARPDVELEAALERALEARQDVDLNLDPALAVERALLALGPARRSRATRTR
jgi:DNA polymerase-3 subunit delta'